MLGVKSNRQPITGKFADDLRAMIQRHETGQLNEADMCRKKFQEQPRKYETVWN